MPLTTLVVGASPSNYTRDAFVNWLRTDVTDTLPSPPTQWWAGILTDTSYIEASYSGYARIEAVSLLYTGSAGTQHASCTFEFNDSFAAATGTLNVASIGIWSASTGGNLLAIAHLSTTLSVGDELEIGEVIVRFNNNTATGITKVNAAPAVSQLMAMWLVNDTVTTVTGSGANLEDVLSFSKDTRAAVIETSASATGSLWGISGGQKIGNALTKVGTVVTDGSSLGLNVSLVPSSIGSYTEQPALTTDNGAVNATFAASSGSGYVTKVLYGIFYQANQGSPPPTNVDGVIDPDDSANIFLTLASWTITPSTKIPYTTSDNFYFTFGLGIQEPFTALSYRPEQTYSDISEKEIEPVYVESSGGYRYAHALVNTITQSTVEYEVTSSFYDWNFDYFDASPDEIPITVEPVDWNSEIVEMRRYTTDVKTGDTSLAFSVKLKSADGDIPNATNKELLVRYSINGGETKEVWGSIPTDYAATGRVIFTLPPNAFDDPGTVRAELVLYREGGSEQTYPVDDVIYIGVARSL